MIEFYRNIDKNFNKSSQILSISWGHFLLKIEPPSRFYTKTALGISPPQPKKTEHPS